MANWTQDAVDALAEAVSERRTYMGVSQIEVWQAGGPSNSTLTSVENASSTSITASTLRKLDAGLAWVEGTALRVLNGEIRPEVAAKDSSFDGRRVSDIAINADLMREYRDNRVADEKQRRQAAVAAALQDFTALIAALAVDADDIQYTVQSIDTFIDTDEPDPDEVANLVSEVEDLTTDIKDFVESVGEVARMVFGGDVERLRRAKRETKKLRRQQAAEQAAREGIPGLSGPIPSYPVAARTVSAEYTPGQGEQGEADGEDSQDEGDNEPR